MKGAEEEEEEMKVRNVRPRLESGTRGSHLLPGHGVMMSQSQDRSSAPQSD